MNYNPLLQTLGVPNFSRVELIERALTHRSYVNENDVTLDNERLEFLGDAVLDLIVGEYLYNIRPALPEGEMTTLRSFFVRAETLAEFALSLSLPDYLLLGNGEDENGGRQKIPTLCATLEAVLGAIHLDQGFTAVKTLVIDQLIDPNIDQIRSESLHKDAKSEFQVWAQAHKKTTPSYKVIDESGPDHSKIFSVQVLVGNDIWGVGTGSSKRNAAQDAAEKAMQKVRQSKES